ncbi:globin [Methylocella silvestris BL2]|uniref:Globin n=1 Tax=Methylocella silvestris (strain DSM 15510 / CIP 108128 / LMG 27833 / NCIMB 13906 / BL2) TaxID=395965 RepID=B8ELT2_METSB|nr:group II truncated hemoglobin [Methylocella silvestris]ACK50713.1 globin [Methylocella silvestris BL2]
MMLAGQAEATEPMFARIGGAIAVDRLVEAFYRRMDNEPSAKALRAMHGEDLGPTRQLLKRYLLEWMGGPKLYTAERGQPRLRERHLSFPIGAPERDAWLFCMRGALEETIEAPDLRADIDAALTKLAFWMRNQADEV